MAFDADLILRGDVSGTYVDLDSSDSAAVSETQNGDGNTVIDIGVGGADNKGLDCIVIFHDILTTYQDTLDIVIQDSHHVAAGFEDMLSFPRVYCFMRELIVTATTAFVAGDIGKVLTATGTGTDTGVIREFSRELLVVGGIGKVWIEMQDSGDTYANAGDTVTATAGTGVGTLTVAGRAIMNGFTLVRRFSTPKRYIRCSNTVSSGDFGAVDIMVTNAQHGHKDNLYRSHV